MMFDVSMFLLGLQASDINNTSRDYKIYWNVPTFICHQYGMYFNDLDKFGIIQNTNDQFRGDKIAILYDPGMFPALMKNPNNTRKIRNGGLPNIGSLNRHLHTFKIHLEEQIQKNFSGLGVIDFESWRPIFRQNWASLALYRDLTIKLEAARHKNWSSRAIEQHSIQLFEAAGRSFMEETIKLAKKLRPNASWGYYAYPYCFNLTPNQPSASCDPRVHNENDQISWLWKLEDTFLPSVYLSKSMSSDERVDFIVNRLKESIRLNNKCPKRPILPYIWYKFRDQTDVFLNRTEILSTFITMLDNGASGMVIWGSSEDFNTKQKCVDFETYLKNTLGPAVLKIKIIASNYPTEED